MVNIALWMKDFTQAMLDVFGERVLFLGLQGSYRRGEATEESDIDVVAVLDEVRLEDLKRYREALRGLPEGEKAGGFISGRHEMLAWPRHELFQFRQDTRAYYGDLDSLLPGFGEEDIRLSARIGAATLYHGLCHGYVRSQGADTLYSSYKSAFFLLQLMCVLRGMPYAVRGRNCPLCWRVEILRCWTCLFTGNPWRATERRGLIFIGNFCWIGADGRWRNWLEGASRFANHSYRLTAAGDDNPRYHVDRG